MFRTSSSLKCETKQTTGQKNKLPTYEVKFWREKFKTDLLFGVSAIIVFFISSFLPAFPPIGPSSFISVQTGFQGLELGNRVGSATDHSQLLRIQHGEDLNTMRAEPARAIANSGLDEYQELRSKGFLPLNGSAINL